MLTSMHSKKIGKQHQKEHNNFKYITLILKQQRNNSCNICCYYAYFISQNCTILLKKKNSIFGAYELNIKKNHNRQNKFGLKPSK